MIADHKFFLEARFASGVERLVVVRVLEFSRSRRGHWQNCMDLPVPGCLRACAQNSPNSNAGECTVDNGK